MIGVWVVAAAFFLIVEIFTVSFFISCFGVGAIAAAGVAFINATAYGWQMGVFVLVSAIAVALTLEDRSCRQAIIVLGAVAPTPRRATEAERLLVGQVVDEALAARAARAALAGATPLAGNEHKLPILETVVARTLLAAAGRPS